MTLAELLHSLPPSFPKLLVKAPDVMLGFLFLCKRWLKIPRRLILAMVMAIAGLPFAYRSGILPILGDSPVTTKT
jgi:hypothetical protein